MPEAGRAQRRRILAFLKAAVAKVVLIMSMQRARSWDVSAAVSARLAVSGGMAAETLSGDCGGWEVRAPERESLGSGFVA